MKKALIGLFVFLAVIPCSFAQQRAYTGKLVFNGDLSRLAAPPGDGMVMLTYIKIDGGFEFDSAVVKNNKFTVTKELSQPIIMVLSMKEPRTANAAGRGTGNMQQYFSAYLMPGEVEYSPRPVLDSAVLTGSGAWADADYKQVLKKESALTVRRNAIAAAYGPVRKNDPAYEAKRTYSLDSMERIRDSYYRKFIDDNPGSPAAVFFLYRYALSPAFESRKDLDPVGIGQLLLRLQPVVRTLPVGIKLKEMLEYSKLTAIGKNAVDISAPDTSGNVVTLSSYKGKYVLVDFWASWCAPCRAENPNVLKAYNRYKDKNFTVLGVSLDRPDARKAWIKAIKDDNLPWMQISELQGFTGNAPQSYGVKSIPMNFLIDPSGKIIAKTLHGEQLQKKLEQLFN